MCLTYSVNKIGLGLMKIRNTLIHSIIGIYKCLKL